MDVPAGSIAGRILRLLSERYPATDEDVAVMLHLRPASVALEIKRLATAGLVTVETVGGRTYVALTGVGFRILGLSPRERGARRREAAATRPSPRDEDDPAFR